MKTLINKKFIKLSIPRILFFGIMGITLLAIPSFVVNGVFYAVVGYLILVGAFGLVNFIYNKDKKNLLDYLGVIISAILILFGISSLVFTRYLVNLSPVYLGTLLLIEGMYYFIIALCGTKALGRSILIILSIIVFLGGACVMEFTFGFGVDGLSGLAKVSAFASIVSCIYALAAYLFNKNAKQPWGGEKKI